MRTINDLAVIIPTHTDIKISTPDGEIEGDLIIVGKTYHKPKIKEGYTHHYLDLSYTACGQRHTGDELAIVEVKLVKDVLRPCRRAACK